MALQQQMASLSRQIAELEDRLGELSADLADRSYEMAPFLNRYQQEVLRRHTDLVEIQRQIADMNLLLGNRNASQPGEADTPLSRLVQLKEYVPVQEQYERVWKGKHPPRPQDLEDNRLPPASPAVREMYKKLAVRLHPDLAADSDEKKRRRIIMDQISVAYVRRDEVSLRAVMDAHQDRRGNLPAVVDEQTVQQIRGQVFLLEQAIVKVEGQVFELTRGDAAKVRAYAIHAQKDGYDLLAQLSEAIQHDLEEARHTLAGLQRQAR